MSPSEKEVNETPSKKTEPKPDTEAYYNDKRLRYITVYQNYGKFDLHTTIATAPDMSAYFWPACVAMWGKYETILVSGSSYGSREKWYYGLSLDETKDIIKRWRKKCQQENLTQTFKLKFST